MSTFWSSTTYWAFQQRAHSLPSIKCSAAPLSFRLCCLNRARRFDSTTARSTVDNKIIKLKFAYLLLHHIRSTSPHHLNIILNKHALLLLGTFQHGVNANVRTSSSDTSTGNETYDSVINQWTRPIGISTQNS